MKYVQTKETSIATIKMTYMSRWSLSTPCSYQCKFIVPVWEWNCSCETGQNLTSTASRLGSEETKDSHEEWCPHLQTPRLSVSLWQQLSVQVFSLEKIKKPNKYVFKYYHLTEEKEIPRTLFIKMINTPYNISVKI